MKAKTKPMEAVFSIGLVLFVFIILVNIVLNLVVRRKDK